MVQGGGRRRLKRRGLLLGAAAVTLAATGCAPPAGRGARGPVVIADAGLFAAVPGLQAAFEASHPAIRIVPYTGDQSGPVHLPAGVRYLLVGAGPDYLLPKPLVALDAPLRAANFDPGVLLAGCLSPFVRQGVTLGLPMQLEIMAVAWRPDVFSAAGLESPSRAWTLEAFVDACGAIAAAMAAGRLPQIGAVLRTPAISDLITDQGLWIAFALGYGGQVVQDGRFALDSRARTGVSALVDILHRFAAPLPRGGIPPSTPTALAFSGWAPGAGPAIARLPRFPARPVIPVGAVAWGVRDTLGGPADAAGLAAAVTALTWLYTAPAQQLLGAAGQVPVLSSPDAQRAFWRQQGAAARAVGDWSDFVVYHRDWPHTPLDPAMEEAVSQAAADPTRLDGLVERALGDMNLPPPGASTGAGP